MPNAACILLLYYNGLIGVVECAITFDSLIGAVEFTLLALAALPSYEFYWKD